MNHDLEMKKIGKRATYIGILGNILLTTFNFAVGFLAGSTALIAEAAHTLSDILTSAVSYIGFRIGMKPPNKHYPYGYGRAEPIIGLIVAIFLGFLAYEILSEAYSKLILGKALIAPDPLAAIMALIGIIVNFAMTSYIMKYGKIINSPAIIADAHHQKVDIFSSAAIFGGIIGARMGFPILDPIIAVFIGLMVLKTAFHIGKVNINHIIGKIPDQILLEDIQSEAMSIEGIYGVHNIKVNYMGPYASVELHIEANGDLTLEKTHEMAHKVEKKIIDNVNAVTIAGIHVCPCKK